MGTTDSDLDRTVQENLGYAAQEMIDWAVSIIAGVDRDGPQSGIWMKAASAFLEQAAKGEPSVADRPRDGAVKDPDPPNYKIRVLMQKIRTTLRERRGPESCGVSLTLAHESGSEPARPWIVWDDTYQCEVGVWSEGPYAAIESALEALEAGYGVKDDE